jgi:uncharacterized damage-inducible protein DinB
MIETFRIRWRQCDRRTAAIFDSARSVDGAFRPSPSYRSLHDQIAHVVAARQSIVRGLTTGDFAWQVAAAECATLELNQLDEARKEASAQIEALLDQANREWLREVISSLSRADWLWALLEHETHHVGQVSMTIRLAGGEPARIFE